MNKKLVAIALVLLIAVSGLFADVISGVGGTINDDVKVTLKAVLGFYLYHGIVDSNGQYVDEKTFTNAFGDTAPSFKYGYETNAAGAPYYIRMAVSDFVNTTTGASGTVKIKSINISHITGELPWNSATSSYTIFTIPANNTYTKTDTTITIYPALLTSDNTDHRSGIIEDTETAAQAPSGEYEATVIFTVSAS